MNLVDGQIQDVEYQLNQIESRQSKLEQEKKKFAAQRLFKEAAQSQNNIKQLQSEFENYKTHKQSLIDKKTSILKEVDLKQEQ